jgi:hypothetical protein
MAGRSFAGSSLNTWLVLAEFGHDPATSSYAPGPLKD